VEAEGELEKLKERCGSRRKAGEAEGKLEKLEKLKESWRSWRS
jgi:hypothetical protein